MSRDFPHLDDTAFPHLSKADPYQYRQDLDYGRYTDGAKLKLARVPWDSGYRNTVDWASESERDAYLDALPSVQLSESTAVYRCPRQEIKVPVPWQTAATANYLIADFPALPSPEDPLAHTSGDGVERWLYFVEDVEELSPSTTRLTLSLDWWGTFYRRISLSNAILARGHAPMAATTASRYLANPLDNSRYLMAPDDSYGSIEVSRSRKALVINDEVWALVFMTGSPRSEWGSYAENDVTTPAVPLTTHGGLPSVPSLAVEPEELEDFLDALKNYAPQAFATIQCVALVPRKLCQDAGTVTYFGFSCHEIYSKGWTYRELAELEKSMWGYPAEYANFAKLYTYPYTALKLWDGDGNTVIVRVEDTSGKLNARTCLTISWPALNIDSYISGIGSADTLTLGFANLADVTIPLAGNVTDTLRRWEIPGFAVYLDAWTDDAVHGYYQRKQAQLAADNAYTSTVASADAALENARESARASLNDNITSSNTSYASTNRNNIYLSDSYLNAADQQAAGMAQSMVQSAWALNTDMQNQMISLASTGTSSVVSGMVAGGAMGSIGGPVGSTGGAIIGGVTAGAGAAFTALTTASMAANKQESLRGSNDTSNEYLQTMYGGAFSAVDPTGFRALYSSFTGGSASGLVGEAGVMGRAHNSAQNTLSRNANYAVRNNHYNAVMGGSAWYTDESGEPSADTAYTGTAVRSNSTAKDNASRALDTATSAIANGRKTAGLRPPLQSGQWTGTGSRSRPVMWCVDVVTQPEGAIRQAAVQFARYGYRLEQPWDIDVLSLMTRFTYWELEDVTVTPVSGAVAGACENIRDILTRGTTVYRSPDNIGSGIWYNEPL